MDNSLTNYCKSFIERLMKKCYNIDMLDFLSQSVVIDITWLFQIPSEVLIAIPQIVLALITALAFFVIGETKDDSIDRELVIKKILLAQQLFPIIIIGSLSLFLINCDLRILPFIYNVTLIMYTLVVLRNFFCWFSIKSEVNNTLNYRQQMRIQFYSHQKSDQDYLRTWDIVLSDKDLKCKNQVGLVDAFILAVSNIKNQENLHYNCDQLIWQFVRNLDKINFYALEDYKKLIKFSLGFFMEYHNSHDEQKAYKPIHAKKTLFIALLDMATSADDTNYGIFENVLFHEIDNAVKDKKFDDNDIAEFLIREIANRSLDGRLRFSEIWNDHELFQRWGIAPNEADNLNKGQKSVLMVYGDVVLNRLYEPSLTNEEAILMDDMTQCIFPGIDPITWFIMCSFFFAPCVEHDDTAWVKAHIETWCNFDRKYGLFGRMSRNFSVSCHDKSKEEFEKELWGQVAKMQEEEQKQTFKTLYGLGVIPRLYEKPLISQIILALSEILEDDKADYNEIYRHRLEKLKKTLEAFQKFEQEQAIS